MRIELAGVPAEVICQHPQNEAFLREYRTDREPLFRVEPTAADLERMGRGMDRIARRDGAPPRPWASAFLENIAIHDLLAERLLDRDVLLMHGSALCMDGEAFLFTAPSGTGKSTHSALWRKVYGDRVWMINDDKPFLRLDGETVTVFGSPWDGKHHLSRNASAPLRGIALLTRSGTNRIEPLPASAGFEILMRQSYAPPEKPESAKAIALKARISQAVRFYRLYCTMEPEAAEAAHDGMTEG